MSSRTLLAGLLLAALTPGCGERPEPTGALPQTYPVTVRGLGEQPVALQARAERIVALDPGTAEIVAALGAGKRLVGVPGDYAGARADDAVFVAGTNGQADIGAATETRADLVATTGASDPIDAREIAEELDAALYVQPDRSVADVARAAIELGYLVGAPVEARRLVESLGADVRRVQDGVAALPPVRAFVDTGFLVTIARRSLASDLLRRAGGVDVAGPGAKPRAYDLCEVVRLRPDVFIHLTEPHEGPLEPPAFDRCRRRGGEIRYVEIRADLVTRAGPRLGTALAEIARALHPDAF